MALPRSIHTAKTAKTAHDPLDGLAERVQDMLANDTQARLAKARVGSWLRALLDTLFPQAAEQAYGTSGEIRDALDASAAELRSLLRPLENEIDDPARIAAAFFQALPEIHRQLLVDATAIERGDPAAESVDEVILAYPGFLAIAVHRIANRFFISIAFRAIEISKSHFKGGQRYLLGHERIADQRAKPDRGDRARSIVERNLRKTQRIGGRHDAPHLFRACGPLTNRLPRA